MTGGTTMVFSRVSAASSHTESATFDTAISAAIAIHAFLRHSASASAER